MSPASSDQQANTNGNYIKKTQQQNSIKLLKIVNLSLAFKIVISLILYNIKYFSLTSKDT